MSDANDDPEDDEVAPEFTEAHVFQCIQELENQAEEEVGDRICYGRFALGEDFDGEKEDKRTCGQEGARHPPLRG